MASANGDGGGLNPDIDPTAHFQVPHRLKVSLGDLSASPPWCLGGADGKDGPLRPLLFGDI